MGGLFSIVSQDDVKSTLIERLKRLEYRGCDSSGVAFLSNSGTLKIRKRAGKVRELESSLDDSLFGSNFELGIGHTRWATHGRPHERNAHPHTSHDRIVVVHNGIIENYLELKARLEQKNYVFISDTDTEVIAHLIHSHRKESPNLLEAVLFAMRNLSGAFSIAVIDTSEPGSMIVAKRHNPLIIGLGDREKLAASDVSALELLTRRYIYLEDGDVAKLTCDDLQIYNSNGMPLNRPVRLLKIQNEPTYNHRVTYNSVRKDIFAQPEALKNTLQGKIADGVLLRDSLGFKACELLKDIESVHIVASDSSYHAAEMARYWLKSAARITCNIELASEYHGRKPIAPANCLFVALSQSGEDADVLAALRYAWSAGYRATLAVCNGAESSLVQESELALLSHVKSESGLAFATTFTTQLLSMLMLTILLGRRVLSMERERWLTGELLIASSHVKRALALNNQIKTLAERCVSHGHVLLLGCGSMYPIAREGVQKLRDFGCIHAEACTIDELRHGRVALVDQDMPVIMLTPYNTLETVILSSQEEVKASGGELFMFTSPKTGISLLPGVNIIEMPATGELIAPLIYAVPLQLLAYHIAVIKAQLANGARVQPPVPNPDHQFAAS